MMAPVMPTSASMTGAAALRSAATIVAASAPTATLPDHSDDVNRPSRRVCSSPPRARSASRVTARSTNQSGRFGGSGRVRRATVTAAAASLSAVASSTFPHSLTVSLQRATRPSNQSVAIARPIRANMGAIGPLRYTSQAIGATRTPRDKLRTFAAVQNRPISGNAGGRTDGPDIERE